MSWLKTWLRALYWAFRISRAVVDPNAKCPACGARNGKIHWEPTVKWPDGSAGAVIHTCQVDGARWGEKPIVKAKDWDIQMQQPQGDPVPFIHRPAADQKTRSFA